MPRSHHAVRPNRSTDLTRRWLVAIAIAVIAILALGLGLKLTGTFGSTPGPTVQPVPLVTGHLGKHFEAPPVNNDGSAADCPGLPDDVRAAQKQFISSLPFEVVGPTMQYLEVPMQGTYGFQISYDQSSCLFTNNVPALDAPDGSGNIVPQPGNYKLVDDVTGKKLSNNTMCVSAKPDVVTGFGGMNPHVIAYCTTQPMEPSSPTLPQQQVSTETNYPNHI
jgi:hypothetical protein